MKVQSAAVFFSLFVGILGAPLTDNAQGQTTTQVAQQPNGFAAESATASEARGKGKNGKDVTDSEDESGGGDKKAYGKDKIGKDIIDTENEIGDGDIGNLMQRLNDGTAEANPPAGAYSDPSKDLVKQAIEKAFKDLPNNAFGKESTNKQKITALLKVLGTILKDLHLSPKDIILGLLGLNKKRKESY
ncbi:hypothetical protein XA68_15853 [Ophiocordyceps unilateralis]|uniref:Secreted protein n=1 Tax=Ophiocordyceps unilateralis TaxID=268505 RepID=A0A2A9P6A4_OPHUN|nr:hypothetical protein XA68_15853 [Ophiocordyceps unilateralis]